MDKHSRRYRLLEMLPGLISWFLITMPVWGSFIMPKVVGYFVIGFLVFWFYQSFKNAILAAFGYFKIKAAKATNWIDKFNEDFRADWLKYSDIQHVVVVSSYKEPNEVIEMAIGSLAAQTEIDLKKIHVVLAQEQRAGKENNQNTIDYFSKKYKNVFGHLIFTEHPPDLPGEIAGKHTNEAWAARYFKKEFIDKGKLNIDNFTLTSCDVDTIFNPKYYSALTYKFAQSPERYYRFWQSPIFWHHNINQVPALIRIVGTIGNVIHIANIQEPDGIFFNYSCYSSSYKLIDSTGYWGPDVISEDWHIFLQAFFASKGRVGVDPIFLPTIVDAPDGNSTYQALKNRYNQSVRHAWGATDIPYAIEQSRMHHDIPWTIRWPRIYKLIESHLLWSSNWFILTLGTSLPVILNPHFFMTTFGFNLPRIANVMLTICLIPLVFLILLDWKLRPDYQKKGFKNIAKNLIQWPLFPIATLFMSVLPGLDSQTRLMLGRRLEYKTTTKKAI